MALTKISTDGFKDDAVTTDKLANAINTERTANTAKSTNATHTGEVTGSGALTITDDTVDEANLKISNAGSNGQFLQKQSGNTGGLTWADATSTTINNNADNKLITGSGTANTLEAEADLTFDGTSLSIPDKIIHTGDTNTAIRFPAADNISMEVAGSEVFRVTPDAAHGSSQSIQLRVDHTIDGATVNMGGTKAYSAGIIRGQVNVRDGQAYNVTDNGGGIGFSAIYNNGGSHTTMSQIEGVKANNTDGNYRGAIKFSTRHHNGNMVEKVRIGQEGLSFEGATADASCIKDYEEGTWTPVPYLSYNPNSRSITLGTSSGSYTKIGRFVFLEFKARWTAISGSGGYNVGIDNLPFSANNTIQATNGVGRSNMTGYTFVCESLTSDYIGVLRRYDNHSPSENEEIVGFASYFV